MKSEFSYLETPAQLYRLAPKSIYEVNGRQLGFYGDKWKDIEYTNEEKQHIRKFRQFAKDHNEDLKLGDQDVLRYLYTANFNYKECLQKALVFLDWSHNPRIQSMNKNSEQILRSGGVYTYGRDKKNRPIVVMDFSQIDLTQNQLDDYFCAINAVISVVRKHCFIQGVIETYLFVIDTGQRVLTLPIDAIGNIIRKLAIVYSMFLGEMLILNVSYLVRGSFWAAKPFIHEDTRKKITLLGKGEMEQIYRLVDPSQLPAKYKGSNPDPYPYWPPTVPGKRQNTIACDDSVYYSILSENEHWKCQEDTIIQTSHNVPCCSKDDCRLF